ncbi:MAG: bifunctional metallophosphatase/5'-nucleotidase [Acidobacteria bacterium]|nr:bifunctional metallophosphatase/5'-nucleotidase [Acidobacteriota bacterium]
MNTLQKNLCRCFWASVVLLSFALPLQAQAGKTVRITLLQVNDVYQIAPVDRGKAGGLARLATLKKKIQAESPNTLFLLSGDTLSPSLASSVFKGEQMIAGWNAAGLDYAALGNHEFDFGDDILLARMRESKFTWLAANVVERKSGKSFGKMPPYVIREFEGIKVGIFGLLTTETETSSSPTKAVRFLPETATAARIVKELRRKGATVIIALTHLSMPADKAVAKAVKVDVIIGGHEHEIMQSLAGCAPIFKMGSDARTLGRIDLNISKTTRKLESMDYAALPVTDTVAEEPTVAAVAGEYEKKLSAELDKPVGNTTVMLDALQKTNRNQESNLGSYILDAFRQFTNADVALINGGSIRSNATYGPGAISKRDVISILPFETPIVKLEVTGAMLRAALEHGVSRVGIETEFGGFPQVSGLRFSYDARKAPGSRVTEVTVNGQPLNDKKTYSLAVGEYLAKGGDGYAMLKSAKHLITAEDAKVDAVILGNAIATAGTISPQTDGRIKRIDQ